MMGSSIQMASSLLDINPGGHLEAKNWFKNKLEAVRNLKIGQILWFFANNSCGDLICSTIMGSSIQMASSLLDVNPGGHLEAKNWFRNKLEAVRNLKIGQILWFFANNSCGDLICSTIMGSSIQMASSLLDVNPGGHLEAKKCFS